MSKKMFGDMKKLCFLVTDDSLIKYTKEHYDGRVQLYRFDIPAMLRAGYEPIK